MTARVEKTILLASNQAFNANAWARLDQSAIGSPEYKRAAADIATSATKIEELTREISAIEDAESARHNARIEADERNMRSWQR